MSGSPASDIPVKVAAKFSPGSASEIHDQRNTDGRGQVLISINVPQTTSEVQLSVGLPPTPRGHGAEPGAWVLATDPAAPAPPLSPGICRLPLSSHSPAHCESPTRWKLRVPVPGTAGFSTPSSWGHFPPEPASRGRPWGQLLSLLLHGVQGGGCCEGSAGGSPGAGGFRLGAQ